MGIAVQRLLQGPAPNNPTHRLARNGTDLPAMQAATQERNEFVRLHLVRHGQTQANLDNVFPGPEARLTGRGKVQARRIGREFLRKGVLVDTILVSPTARTLETMGSARILLPAIPRVVVVSGLAEKDAGAAIGRAIPPTFDEVDRVSVKRGGESFPQFIERVEGTFSNILADIRAGRLGGNITIFGHSLVNRICLGMFQGVGGARGLEGPSQLNGGIKTLEIRRE